MDYSSKAKSSNVHYFAPPIGIVQYGRVHSCSWHNHTPHHPVGAADGHPLHRCRLRAERQPQCEAVGGVLLRLRHHPDPGGQAGGDRRREGQIVSFGRRKRFAKDSEEVATSSGKADCRQEGPNVSFCNLYGNGLMLVLAPLAAATATASPVNAMAVAFFATGARPLGTCPGPTFASRDF